MSESPDTRSQQLIEESWFKGAFETASIGMALVSPEGKWLRVNDAVCQIVGYSREELLQKTFQDITHPDDLDADLAFVKEMLDGTRETYTMEKRYFHKDGHVVWVLLSVSLVWKDEKPDFFVSQIQDITAQKTMQQQLEDRVKELELMNRSMVNREEKMAELKEEISRLKEE